MVDRVKAKTILDNLPLKEGETWEFIYNPESDTVDFLCWSDMGQIPEELTSRLIGNVRVSLGVVSEKWVYNVGGGGEGEPDTVAGGWVQIDRLNNYLMPSREDWEWVRVDGDGVYYEVDKETQMYLDEIVEKVLKWIGENQDNRETYPEELWNIAEKKKKELLDTYG